MLGNIKIRGIRINVKVQVFNGLVSGVVNALLEHSYIIRLTVNPGEIWLTSAGVQIDQKAD